MSATTEGLERFQRQVNAEVAHNQAKKIHALEAVLRRIVHEYDQTYDAEQDCASGRWLGAASIPLDVMEEAKRLCE